MKITSTKTMMLLLVLTTSMLAGCQKAPPSPEKQQQEAIKKQQQGIEDKKSQYHGWQQMTSSKQAFQGQEVDAYIFYDQDYSQIEVDIYAPDQSHGFYEVWIAQPEGTPPSSVGVMSYQSLNRYGFTYQSPLSLQGAKIMLTYEQTPDDIPEQIIASTTITSSEKQ